MFGALKPVLGHVPKECKQLYTSTYCNLCAALSASGAGAWNRFFLVNDVVTIDWLLAEANTCEDHAFACYNCVKGGVLGRKNKVSERQAFLAAVSSYVCGVKIKDNAIDDPKLKNKSLAMVYRPIMKKAESTLQRLGLLDKLKTYQVMDRENEINHVSRLDQACEPTERCYQLLTMENAKQISSLPSSIVALLGQYLGRCVYLLDAIEDMDEDKKKNQYNVLNQLSTSQPLTNTKELVIGQCLDFIKPLRIELTEKLALLPDSSTVQTIRKKWESVFISIERQLFKLVKPLNCTALLSNLASFSTLTQGCPQCSSWSSIMACCPCCPCCVICECCPCIGCCSSCCVTCCPCCSCCGCDSEG